MKEDTEIARVAEPGAVFAALSVLLNQPHTADVRALETSHFHTANSTMRFEQNPMAVLYVATVLAHRLDGANHALIQLKHQLSTVDGDAQLCALDHRPAGRRLGDSGQNWIDRRAKQ